MVLEIELRFSRSTKKLNTFITNLLQNAGLKQKIEKFWEIREKNLVHRMWASGKIECYKKITLESFHLYYPFGPMVVISREENLPQSSDINHQKSIAVERSEFVGEKILWHLKTRHINEISCTYSIEVELKEDFNMLEREKIIKIFTDEAGYILPIIVLNKVRSTFANLLGTHASLDEEVSRMAPARPKNITQWNWERISGNPKKWLVSVKLDGFYTIMAKFGEYTVILSDSNSLFYKKTSPIDWNSYTNPQKTPQVKWTILEAESIGEKFFVFDAPVVEGIRNASPYFQRLKLLNRLIHQMPSSFKLEVKKFFELSDVKDPRIILENSSEKADGLIFASRFMSLKNQERDIFRWKKNATIDVILQFLELSNGTSRLVHYVAGSGVWAKNAAHEMEISYTFLVEVTMTVDPTIESYILFPLFTALLPNLFDFTITYSRPELKTYHENHPNAVFEVSIVPAKKEILVLKARPEKKWPNNHKVAREIILGSLIGFDVFSSGESHFSSRSYNMWRVMRYAMSMIRKHILIQNIGVGEEVMDFGAGRGSSIIPLLEAKHLSSVHLLDIDIKALVQAFERIYALSEPSWENLGALLIDFASTAGLQELKNFLKQKLGDPYTTIFSINAIQYGAVSEEHFITLLEILKSGLSQNGQMIFIFPDSNKINGLLDQNNEFLVQKGNQKKYHIEVEDRFPNDEQEPVIELGSAVYIWREYDPDGTDTEPACPGDSLRDVLEDLEMKEVFFGGIFDYASKYELLLDCDLEPEDKEFMGIFTIAHFRCV